MSKKATYKELEQRLKELEREAVKSEQAEERIKHLNLVLRAIRTVNQLITREKDRNRLLKDICDNLIQTRGYYNAWIALVHESGRVTVTAEAGLGKDFLPMIDYFKRQELTQCGRKALKQSEVVVTEDPLSACTDCPLADKYAGRGAMSVRLRYEGKAYGLLSASIPRYFLNDKEEQLLFQELARDIAFALHNIELEEERNQAEEALRESEVRFRDLVEGSIQGIVIHRNFKPLFVNKAWADIYGYTVDEMLEMDTIVPLFAPHEHSRLSRYNKARLRGGDVASHYEYQGVGKDASLIWIENIVRLVHWQGKPAVQATILDITKRKQAEEALADQKERLSVTLRSIGDGVITTDVEGRVTLMSNVAEELTGWAEEEAVGRTLNEVFRIINEETRERCKNPVEKVMATGKIVGLGDDTVLIARDGTERALVDSGAPIHDHEGKIIGVVLVFRDITEKKKLEAQFQAAQKMEALGTLAGGIAHDFNNLLMAIQGNASLMLLEKASDDPDYERLKNIEQGVRSGAELTRQLLGFAMGGKYEVKPTDINELIRRTSDMFGRTKKEITIHTKYQEGIWPVEVDQGQIEQVLLNLYVNAWQAMPGGGELYLETENVTLDDKSVKPFDLTSGRYVKIALTDTGVGMDEATQQRIFEPFFTTKEMGRGTGLALASVYGIIKNHGGIITVDSTKGKGTTFTMYLPASEKEVIEERELLPGEALKGTETVLLVDEEEMVLDVGEGILKELGYKVLIARSGKEAIEIVSKGPNISPAPDIVILDMIMPVMGGAETYDRLKEINPDIKVLLSSGYSIDGQAQEIMDRGCNGFIQKPFSMRELSQEVRGILDSQ
jgi:two-component system cell cycle sensor histidine kinase/response regulator CckA